MHPPGYFEAIRRNASARWDQLERDPELAAPWHQLFKQVQSPRHVLSELLQNADDAGATQAVVSIQDGTFVFAHNGADFSEEHFQSLCRFGYSNKRSLHTIGFRGIGFKSTFSIGDEVRLSTPTLSISFRRERFTEPTWIQRLNQQSGWTEIHVVIKDEHRQRELEKNLQEWCKSSLSLLFFRSIRRLLIGEEEIHWESDGPGPVAESEWMKLSTASDRRYLLVRSPEETFPEAALEEIQQERMMTDDEISFPPCRVEIVLGMEGRLFVVLPTGVKTTLPFACSAPFVQDPARVKIKDPEISPTNRWLLKRIGELAARASLGWAGRTELPLEQRCEAYQLWIDLERGDNSVEATCAAIAREAFGAVMKNAPCLLSDAGKLENWQGCVAVPRALLDVWSADQVSALFDNGKHPVLSRYMTDVVRQRLARWSSIREISMSDVIEVLKSIHPPRPKTWRQLMLLWACVAREILSPRYFWGRPTGIRIMPVNGSDVLYAGNEVVRLGERQLLQSQDDWAFLAKYLLVLNQNWTRYLTEQRREAEEEQQRDLGEQVEAAYKLLRELGLNETSDMGQVMALVAERFFGQGSCSRQDCVRLAHIAAKLSAAVPESFQVVTHDGYRRPLTSQIVIDSEGDLDLFVDSKWYDDHVIHADYSRDFTSCTESEWRQWSTSPRSGIFTFVPLGPTQRRMWGKKQVLEELANRGLHGEPSFPYKGYDFQIEDWDFESGIWEQWKRSATEDEGFWCRVMARILKQPQSYWVKATAARTVQVAKTGHTRAVTSEPLLPGWIMKFRDLPCLQDTWGRYCHPAELLRRTPETEALLDAEPFVKGEFDTESLRPLLVLLGVRDTPTGPGPLLERLGALAGLAVPPLHEVQKWYYRLDQMVDHCSTEEFHAIKAAFRSNNLILTESQGWVRSTEVFLAADEEDVPGAAVVHPAGRHLALWRKLDVHERPTVDLAIGWLKSLPSGRSLSTDELRRVRSLLPRYPDRVWIECGSWLNLEGEWVPATGLGYALTMQSLVPWKHLFPLVKARTADLQKLPADVCERYPFSSLPRLGSSIEERVVEQSGGLPTPLTKPWMTVLGVGLERIILDDPDETLRIRALGKRLARTLWQTTTGLETEPYLAGTPAGTSRRSDALWRDCSLYVEDRSTAKMAAAVPQEIGRVLNRFDISDAIKLCYERSPEFVSEYLETNFSLAPSEVMNAPEPVGGADSGDDGGLEITTTLEPQEDRTVLEDRLGGQNARESPGQTLTRNPREPKPTQPGLIELFAIASGFTRDGADRFYHRDGIWLAKTGDSVFPWERRSAAGESLQYYWIKDHCIERVPLQLESEIWMLCEQSPDRYSLILATPEGNPVEISGRRLMELRDGGQLTLHPATYRLVYRT